MTAWRNLSGQVRAKYKSKKVSTDGYSFASQLEASVYQMLKLRMKAGEFKSLHVQKHVLICGPEGHACSHQKKVEIIIDFACERHDGSFFFVEAKGFRTAAYQIKRRLWMHYAGRLEVWGGSYIRPMLLEVIGE